MYATLFWTSKRFPKFCKPLVVLTILMHGVISLPDATSYDNIRILYVCRVEIEVSNPRNDLADRNRGLPRFRSARSFRGLETSI